MSELRTGWLAGDIGVIDLDFQGYPALIAAYIVPTSDGLALIETGPGSTLPALKAGLVKLDVDFDDIRHVLVTHIHLDHAGAVGSLLADLPNATFYVHERGLRHMLNPERLVSSARQIYGALMDPLWGEFLPTPEDRTVSIAEDDIIQLGETRLHVYYTPGHASHHVSFLEPERNVLFAGDVAGVRVPPSPLVWPPTPPPDIDVEAWHASIARLRDLRPERLLITHFGAYDDVPDHFDRLDARLDEWVGQLEAWREDGLARDAMVTSLERAVRNEIENEPSSATTMYAAKFVMPAYMNIDGLARYLDKRNTQPTLQN